MKVHLIKKKKKMENFSVRSKEKAQITRCLKFKRLLSPAIRIDTHTRTHMYTRVRTGLKQRPECGGLEYLGKEIRLDPAVIGSHGRF